MKIPQTVKSFLGGGIVGCLLTMLLGSGLFGSGALVTSRVNVYPDEALCSHDLQIARDEVRSLREKLSEKLATEAASNQADSLQANSTIVAATENNVQGAEESATDKQDVTAANEEALRWRVSAIEKFVPLSENQRERLRRKFIDEGKRGEGGDSQAESLEDIVGADNARFYREQVSAAFKRHRDQQLESEVLWLSRRLGLTPEQEQSMKGVFSSVEQQLEADPSMPGSERASASAQEGVKRIIAENRRRTELRNEQLKGVLSAEQYSAFLRAEAESSANDVEVFHDPG